MRLRQIAIFVLVMLCLSVAYAWTMPVEKYIQLRKELEAGTYSVDTVSSSPSDFRGRVIELRGSVSGTATLGDTIRVILQCDGDHQIITCDKNDRKVTPPPSGALVAILAVIGEESSYSLSDLRMVDWCYNAELKAWEASAAERAKQDELNKEYARKALEKTGVRGKRGERPTSRGKQDYGGIFPAYRKAVASFNPKLSAGEVDRITDAILNFSVQYDVDPRLVMALVLAESHFNPEATSPKGAMGLGQLMPGTARGLGVGNAYDPTQNLAGAVKLIRGHLDKQSGKASYGNLTWRDLELALASYNAGPGAVKKYGGIPPYRETQNYVKKVIKYYKKLCGMGE